MEPEINIIEPRQHSFTNRFFIKALESGKNQFWMYFLGILAALLGYSLYLNLIAIPLGKMAMKNGASLNDIIRNPNIILNADIVGINRSLMLALLGGMFFFTILFLYFVLKWVHKKAFASIITYYQKIRWGRYFFAFFVWGSLIIIVTAIWFIVYPQEYEIQFYAPKFFLLILVSCIILPIQTAAEELVFRGYMFQGLGLLFKNGIIPLIITSVIFGLMHGGNPETKAYGAFIMMPYYILFGVFLGMLTLLDEGLELALGIHCANNLISSLLICSKNSAFQTDSIFYALTENPIEEFVKWIILACICFFILFKKYHLSNFKLLIR